MSETIDLQARRLYSFPQIDRLLNLPGGTSSRWIDGYQRAGRQYAPVVRVETTGDQVATWGEFVECRLLAEFRDSGVSIQRMRPAVDRLRDVTGSEYPLTSARLWLGLDGRDMIAAVQDEVNLDRHLSLVVVRSGQQEIDWTDRARSFSHAVRWSSSSQEAVPIGLKPDSHNDLIEIDPRRGYGDPVIRGRNVTTSIIRELVAAGEPLEAVAASYELTVAEVEAAIRYELSRSA